MPTSASSLCTCDSQLASLDQHLLDIQSLQSTYGGIERTLGNLTGTQNNLARIRELLTLGAGGADDLLLSNLRDFNRLIMEYQLKRDIQGDTKIYGWDYVHVDDPGTPEVLEPQPILRGIAEIPEVAEKVLYGRIETIPGDMPSTGDYNGPVAGIFGFITGDIQPDPEDQEFLPVVLTLSGAASKTTQSFEDSGGYRFVGLSAGNYTVTPSLSGFTFSPASINVSITAGTLAATPPNITGQNFAATSV